LGRVARDRDNFLVALERALSAEKWDDVLRLSSYLRWYWYIRGHLKEGRRWLEVEPPPEATIAPELRADVLNAAGTMAYQQRDLDGAQSLYEQCLAIREEQGDTEGTGLVLGNLGMIATDRQDYVLGREYFTRSLELLESSGHIRGMANALANLGDIEKSETDYEAARAYYERAISLDRDRGDEWAVGSGQFAIARLSLEVEDFETAGALLSEALLVYRKVGNKQGTAVTLSCLAESAVGRGDYALAKSYLEESIAVSQEIEVRPLVGNLLCDLGRVSVLLGDPEEGERLLTEGIGVCLESGSPLGVHVGLWALAALSAERDQPERATRLWAAAEDIDTEAESFVRVSRALYPLDEPGLCSLRGKLGDAAFEEQWERGTAMTLTEAVAMATLQPRPTSLEEPPSAVPEQLTARQALKRKFGGLTAREREVAVLIVQGLTNAEIAEDLSVVLKTVEKHVSNILSKLGFERRAQVAAWAVENGLAEAPVDLDTQLRSD
jgi:DNA-binding CsgD family transcriptional regulator/tetratricopeptide (TPR) repeat protein